jgi:hypothetical protein
MGRIESDRIYSGSTTRYKDRRAAMLTIVFLILLGSLAIAGVTIAYIAGSRRRKGRRKGQHGAPFESTKSTKTGRAPGLD